MTTSTLDSARALRDLSPVGDCVLWFAGVDWNDVRGTDRNLVEAMDVPVVWVDSPRTAWRSGGRWLPAPWGGGVQVMRADPLIVRVTPAIAPLSARVGVRRTVSPLKRWQVKGALRSLGASPVATVWTYLDPAMRGWSDATREVLVGTDDYVAGAQLMGLSQEWLELCEQRSLDRCDTVVAITEALADRWRERGAAPLVMPNGCAPLPRPDVAARPRPERGPADAPVAGLVGQLSERIDMDVLEAVVEAGISLLLVGPVDRRWEPQRFATLVGHPLVEYVGQVPAADLPGLLARMDVGLTPYADSGFNRASFPLKTLEYLGAGIPVATTDLPASRWLRDDLSRVSGPEAVHQSLRIVDGPAAFPEAIRELAASRDAIGDLARWDFASTHSWSNRAKSLQELIGVRPPAMA